MLTIKLALPKYNPTLIILLKELDLYYPRIKLTNFLLAFEDKKIIGLAQLKEYKKFYFLYSFGIIPDQQNKGLGLKFLQNILKNIAKPVYLYTIIPDFFLKNGFTKTVFHNFLPSKQNLECNNCNPEKCVCLIYKPK